MMYSTKATLTTVQIQTQTQKATDRQTDTHTYIRTDIYTDTLPDIRDVYKLALLAQQRVYRYPILPNC